MLFNLIGVFSESIISIYPILIKLTKLDIPINTFIRLSSYFIISSLFANYSILQNIGASKLLGLAVVNIVHILSSYYGFRYLVPSLAESIFYMYPFLNLLFNILIINEAISLYKFVIIIPVLLSIYSIYSQKKSDAPQNLSVGIPMIIISAITESLLYILIKTTELGSNPWNTLLVSYSLAAILYGGYYLYNHGKEFVETVKRDTSEVVKITIANMFVGLLGYGLRFYTIPRVPSVNFSIISFTGIITTVFYSYLFSLEKFTFNKVISIAVLVLSLITMKFI